MTFENLHCSRRISLVSLVTLVTLVALMFVGLLVGPGCSRDDASSAKPPKVDCQRLCDKTFGSCVTEVLLVSGKMDAKKVAAFKRLGLLKKVQKQGLDQCMSECRAKKGKSAYAKMANRCLAMADCKKFATCVTRQIK